MTCVVAGAAKCLYATYNMRMGPIQHTSHSHYSVLVHHRLLALLYMISPPPELRGFIKKLIQAPTCCFV